MWSDDVERTSSILPVQRLRLPGQSKVRRRRSALQARALPQARTGFDVNNDDELRFAEPLPALMQFPQLFEPLQRTFDITELKRLLPRLDLYVSADQRPNHFDVLVTLNEHRRSVLAHARQKAGDAIKVLVKKTSMDRLDADDLRRIMRRAKIRISLQVVHLRAFSDTVIRMTESLTLPTVTPPLGLRLALHVKK
jgi:hypothetical protein